VDFSLVLTSCDRVDDLFRFLAGLNKSQFTGSIEVIFVNQGQVLENLSARLPESVVLHCLEIGHKLPLSEARNLALMKSNGDIIGFPDDDCWYSPTVLVSLHKLFEELPCIQCICTNVFDPDRGLSYGGRPIGTRRTVNFSNIFSLPISVGIFVRRGAFEAAGARFDESLGAGTVLGSGEETELIARLLESGADILYAGDVSVFHPVPNYDQNDASKFHAYGLGYGYLSSKFVRKGHYIVMLNLINLIIRSLGGFVIFIFNRKKRNVYQSRLNGILRGSFMAFTDSKADVN
jgi:glycosyltransferase involved in cell wall biosynthesis